MANNDKAFSLLIPVTTAVLTLAVLWFYWPVLAKLTVNLVDSEDYSFGLLLPFVGGYIVYLKLPQIRSYLWRPSWLGLLVIAFGFGLIYSRRAGRRFLPSPSFFRDSHCGLAVPHGRVGLGAPAIVPAFSAGPDVPAAGIAYETADVAVAVNLLPPGHRLVADGGNPGLLSRQCHRSGCPADAGGGSLQRVTLYFVPVCPGGYFLLFLSASPLENHPAPHSLNPSRHRGQRL